MPFGISSASKIMLKRNKETSGDIQGVHVIADDLIIAQETTRSMTTFCTECYHGHVTRVSNSTARRFNSKSVKLKTKVMGNLVSSDSLKPDPRKIEPTMNMLKPMIIHVLVVLGISSFGFKRISTVTIMYLLYSVNVYIFSGVIEIKLYYILYYSTDVNSIQRLLGLNKYLAQSSPNESASL